MSSATAAPPAGAGDGTLVRAILDSSLDGIVMMDEQGTLREFSPAAERIFGHRREAVLGRPLGEVIVPEHLRAAHAAGLARLLGGGESRLVGRRIETEGARADGSVFPIELTIVIAHTAGERLFVAYLRDITERRRSEAEIARQREALYQQEKLSALGSLLAGVAHELNNPLAVVLGRAVMLEEELTDPAQAASAAKLRAAAERCAKIVATFLAMARQKPQERRPVAIGRVLDAALDMVAYGLRSAGVEVERHVDQDLPAVLADEDQLHQLLLNLLVNGQHALRDLPGTRRLLLRTTHERGWVRIDVEDNGPGIPAAIRPRIFEPFFTTKPQGMGTGIGLSVCHGIVTAHGGTIEAGERPGGGASFTVRLPLAGSPHLAPAPEPAVLPAAAARILVVDDEPEIRAMVGEILERDGHAVEHAASGREALAHLAGREFDLIISDLRMPDIDGRELHRQLSASRPELAARMLFLTGDTLGAAPTALPGIAATTLIEKPVLPAALRAAVRQHLRTAR